MGRAIKIDKEALQRIIDNRGEKKGCATIYAIFEKIRENDGMSVHNDSFEFFKENCTMEEE